MRPAPRSPLLPLVLASLAALAACGRPAPAPETQPAVRRDPPMTTGGDLLRRMHDQYAGKWFRTLAWHQKNIVYSARGEQRSEWLEYLSVPGKLRIDLFPLQDKSGVLFVDNVQHSFNGGKLVDSRPIVHALVVLSADVYAQSVERTIALVDSLDIDLDVLRQETLGGRPHWIVGAEPGDTTRNQFWVDADSLLVRRVVQRSTRQGRTTVSDTRFTYQTVGGFAVPQEILIQRDGRPYQRQQYTDVRVNVDLPAEMFDPAKFAATQQPVP